MIKYFKMKWALKKTVYTAIFDFIKNHKDIIALIHKLYISLKDIPAENLQKEFLSALAEIIHTENQKETTNAQE